jgi:hypothetical protein
MQDVDLEIYKKHVEDLGNSIHELVTEKNSEGGEAFKLGACDALIAACTAALSSTIVSANISPVCSEASVKILVEKSVGWLVCKLSDEFELAFGEGKTLFGLSPKSDRVGTDED